MEIEKGKILEELGQIRHPETREDIVSMGMVEDAGSREGHLWITLRFKRPNDPFIQSIKKACQRRLNQKFGATTLEAD